MERETCRDLPKVAAAIIEVFSPEGLDVGEMSLYALERETCRDRG